jgi:arylsulfatase A-like enzyme
MAAKISRRDFLKLSGLAQLGLTLPRLAKSLAGLHAPNPAARNIIVLVFDALSGLNLALDGYARETAPNLTRLAKRAIVYHNHFAASNFTSSGTASLLTGTLPWTHRAIEDNGTVAQELVDHNIFRAFPDYYRTAFTHNSWVQTLLDQFRDAIDDLVPRDKMYLETYDELIHTVFYRDDDIADVSWTRDMKLADGYSYSLFLSRLYKTVRDASTASLESRFPRGVPMNASKDAFLLEQSAGWLDDHMKVIPRPFLGYFHFLPPHAPYRTSSEFYGRFASDGLSPVRKPLDKFGTREAERAMLESRSEYDEFILYADESFGSMYDSLERSGLLENTWLLVTSDHGEMFERGLIGHGNPTLYQPVIRIPLLIFEPGREAGLDIDTPTSAVDVLPTLAHVTGHAIPEWVEGGVLPPYSTILTQGVPGVYAVQARKSHQYLPLTRATVTLVKKPHKVIYYFGYAELGMQDVVQMYDIQTDPEERVDLSKSQPDLTSRLLAELKHSMAEADRPYAS